MTVLQNKYNEAQLPSEKTQSATSGFPGISDPNTMGKLLMIYPYNQIPGVTPIELKFAPGAIKSGTTDVWAQGKKKLFQLDASVSNMFFRDMVAVLGYVDHPQNVNALHLEVISKFVDGLPAPAFPFQIDSIQQGLGKIAFEKARCAACHIPNQHSLSQNESPRVFQMGLSPNRYLAQNSIQMGAAAFASILGICKNVQNSKMTISIGEHSIFPCDPQFDFKSIIKVWPEGSQGYLANPLDGVWAKAPYLQNSSVPTLWHLLGKAGKESLRPAKFLIGSLDYDTTIMGWEWETAKESVLKINSPALSTYDTQLDGFSNRGHESLDENWVDPSNGESFKLSWDIESESERNELLALMEYLKSL